MICKHWSIWLAGGKVVELFKLPAQSQNFILVCSPVRPSIRKCPTQKIQWFVDVNLRWLLEFRFRALSGAYSTMPIGGSCTDINNFVGSFWVRRVKVRSRSCQLLKAAAWSSLQPSESSRKQAIYIFWLQPAFRYARFNSSCGGAIRSAKQRTL